jgi:TetR/AcrR family transcriptional repressor of nem operon
MAWSKEHKAETRKAILKSAAELFLKHGYDHVGINDVMKHANLTRGAFYHHFTSKSDLYAHAIKAQALSMVDFLNPNAPGSPPFSTLIEHYLCQEHKDGMTINCPLAYLVSDINQRDAQVRSTYTQLFKGFTGYLEERLEQSELPLDKQYLQQESLMRAVMMIGGLSLARALDDESLSHQVLEACQANLKARDLG